MRYYMIQWQPEADDDPVRMYLELSDDGLTAYRRFGFIDIPRYNDSPLDNTVYLRLDL